MKSLNFIIHYQLYPFDVMISLGESDAILFPKLKKHLPESDWPEIEDMKLKPTGRGRMVMFSSGATAIRIRDYPVSAEHFGHLQHEIFHAVEFLMERIGVKHSYECGETYAYAIQYLTEKIYEKLKWPKNKS
jgi:hypothetical protein